MLRIPAAELPLASERDRVKMLKQRILDTDKFDKTFLVRPAAASSTLQMATPQSPMTYHAAHPQLLLRSRLLVLEVRTMVAAALGCRHCSLPVLQLCPP